MWQPHQVGAAAVKVFPVARLGGAAYVRDLLAPVPDLRLMATGGVDIALAWELIHARCVAVGVGTVAIAPVDAGLPADERATRFLSALRAERPDA